MGNEMTARDRQVVELLLLGCGDAEIAKLLGLPPRTVKGRFNRMFKEFGIKHGHRKRIRLALRFFPGKYRHRKEGPLLTRMEWRVTAMVAQGWSNLSVACKLRTTENVTRNYLRQIFDKTGMSSRLELALWYVEPVQRAQQEHGQTDRQNGKNRKVAQPQNRVPEKAVKADAVHGWPSPAPRDATVR
jgi:DNA-binding NarL/FixJ family response regulator